MENKELKIREDLNSIVKNIRTATKSAKTFDINLCIVTLFNGEELEFADKDGVGNLLAVQRKCGVNTLKDKILTEELQEKDGKVLGKYICVNYIFEDGRAYKMFPSKRTVSQIIDMYYDFYKKSNKGGAK